MKSTINHIRWFFARAFLNVVIALVPLDESGRKLLDRIFDWMAEQEDARSKA